MKAFTQHTGQVFAFDRANIDTDAILPKQYLKSIRKFGYGDWLFDDLRYLDPGEVTTPIATRRKNPDFPLNNPDFANCSILLAKDNFGCGSSREHAVWALRDYGFSVVIAPSFADIFYSNCFKNGLLPIALDIDVILTLFTLCSVSKLILTIDLEKQSIATPNHKWHFDIEPSRKRNLLDGLDEISITLKDSKVIRNFEAQLQCNEPWNFGNIS